MGKYYKIGHTGSVGRRQYEIALRLPEKLMLVHSLTTDDPAGIEACWHKRFEPKRANGEWFELSAQDVRAFKRRTLIVPAICRTVSARATELKPPPPASRHACRRMCTRC
jgi:hypothetical protein